MQFETQDANAWGGITQSKIIKIHHYFSGINTENSATIHHKHTNCISSLTNPQAHGSLPQVLHKKKSKHIQISVDKKPPVKSTGTHHTSISGSLSLSGVHFTAWSPPKTFACWALAGRPLNYRAAAAAGWATSLSSSSLTLRLNCGNTSLFWTALGFLHLQKFSPSAWFTCTYNLCVGVCVCVWVCVCSPWTVHVFCLYTYTNTLV